MYGLALL